MYNFSHNVLKLSHLISSKMMARACANSTSSYPLPHCVKTQVAFFCLDLHTKIQNLVIAAKKTQKVSKCESLILTSLKENIVI